MFPMFGFVHAVPYAKQNIGNIHQEMFASGEISTGELDFIRGLPNDGRILTYGMFNNAIDFGCNYLTGKYFSRDERAEFNLKRKLFEKVHGQDSFGEPDIVLAKSGVELANYLRLGGWKYLWLDARHPISQHVILELTPGIGRQIYGDVPDKYKSGNATDYAYPIYANGPFFMFTVNGSNYAEKVDVVRNLTESVYSTGRGYAYTAISPYYHFDTAAGAVDVPLDPEPVAVERVSPTEARLSGDFREGGYVVFKEYYFERWKAYMNGREVPVLSTIQELVLIKTEKGDSITLVYGVLPKEKVVAAVSFLAHLGNDLLLWKHPIDQGDAVPFLRLYQHQLLYRGKDRHFPAVHVRFPALEVVLLEHHIATFPEVAGQPRFRRRDALHRNRLRVQGDINRAGSSVEMIIGAYRRVRIAPSRGIDAFREVPHHVHLLRVIAPVHREHEEGAVGIDGISIISCIPGLVFVRHIPVNLPADAGRQLKDDVLADWVAGIQPQVFPAPETQVIRELHS